MAAPVVHFEILGKDGEKLQDFYSNIFDWKINADNPMNYGLISPEREHSIGGGIGPAPEGQPGHLTIYIEVDDPQAYLVKIEEKGGKTIVPVTTIPDMVTFALFTDPEGNMAGLVKSEKQD